MASVASLSRGQRAVIACAALTIRYLESLAQGQAGWNARALLDANGYRTAFQTIYRDFRGAIIEAYPSMAAAIPAPPVVGSGFTAETRDAMRVCALIVFGNPAQLPLASMPTAETGLGTWYLREGLGDLIGSGSALERAVIQLQVYTGANVGVEASTWAFGFINQLALPGPVQDSRSEPAPSSPTVPTAMNPMPGPIDPPPPPPGVTTTPPQVPASSTSMPTTTTPSEPQRHVAGSSFFVTGRTRWQKFPLWAVLLGVGLSTAGVSMLWLKYRGKGKTRPRKRRRR